MNAIESVLNLPHFNVAVVLLLPYEAEFLFLTLSVNKVYYTTAQEVSWEWVFKCANTVYKRNISCSLPGRFSRQEAGKN